MSCPKCLSGPAAGETVQLQGQLSHVVVTVFRVYFPPRFVFYYLLLECGLYFICLLWFIDLVIHLLESSFCGFYLFISAFLILPLSIHHQVLHNSFFLRLIPSLPPLPFDTGHCKSNSNNRHTGSGCRIQSSLPSKETKHRQTEQQNRGSCTRRSCSDEMVPRRPLGQGSSTLSSSELSNGALAQHQQLSLTEQKLAVNL